MNAVPFDTLKMAKRLEAAGFAVPQAAGAAEALAEALIGADLATKGDVDRLESSIRGDMDRLESSIRGDMDRLETGIRGDAGRLESGIRGDMGHLETGMRGDMTRLESGIRKDMATLETKVLGAIELARRDMTIKLGGLMIVAVGVLLAALHYIPPHP